MSSKDKPESFTDLLNMEVGKNQDDIYDLKNFGDSKAESRLQVKWNRIRKTLFGDAGVSNKFFQGVMMGATVGAVAGTLFGVVSFFQHRKFIYIPLVAISMSISFGFFMGVGTVIRTEEQGPCCDRIVYVNGQVLVLPAGWKEKYRVD